MPHNQILVKLERRRRRRLRRLICVGAARRLKIALSGDGAKEAQRASGHIVACCRI